MSDETTPKDETEEIEAHRMAGRATGRAASANDEPTEEGEDNEVEAHRAANRATNRASN